MEGELIRTVWSVRKIHHSERQSGGSPGELSPEDLEGAGRPAGPWREHG